MRHLPAHRIQRQGLRRRQLGQPVAVGQDHRRMAAAFAVGEIDAPAVFFLRQPLCIVPVLADQALTLRQRDSAARQFGRAEPAA